MFATNDEFEVIVCGGGHAGCEAALAAARMGASTLLLTGNLDTLAQMSCNPAIGGQAKGQIVREIDALGGQMGVNADFAGIQFRLLNESKGAAVRSPRVQCDKKVYQFGMKHVLELQAGLSLFQATVTGLIYDGNVVTGVRTNLDISFRGKTIVVTTGTFLRGLMHIGTNINEGGRLGDFSAKTLSANFEHLGIRLKRFKTGTPPRLLGRSLDFTKMAEQVGDARPTRFSFYDTRPIDTLFHVERGGRVLDDGGPPLAQKQVSCWMTYTTDQTASLVRDHLHLSAMYSGGITGTGPRYCPSVEDKFVKFADKPRHLLFLEPEGLTTDEYYVNGLSTSLPFDLQLKLVHSIPGLDGAHLMRPAYAVEYDYAPPTQLLPSLESKVAENLFFAGQINGTSGYEEAAAQGLIAGVNAVCKVRNLEPLIIKRHEGYIGVLIDDLVNRGTNEPYRMFTSRAEHRLLFNHGSAELRLWHHAERLGLIPQPRLAKILAKAARKLHWCGYLEEHRPKGGESTWGDEIRRCGAQSDKLPEMPLEFRAESSVLREEVFYAISYKGYLEREERQIAKLRDAERIKVPANLDYGSIKGLRKESVIKLMDQKPVTLGQAARISGVNPSDIGILMVFLAAEQRRRGEPKFTRG